jgi:uracil-DNA glycosylase
MDQIKALLDSLPSDWKEIFFHKDGVELLKVALKGLAEYAPTYEKLCPPLEDVFNAFHQTPYYRTRIVIIGQDPYHTDDIAHGMSFSVNPTKSIPPSLMNIYKCLQKHKLIEKMPEHGCLYNWASQGVLLLNSALTTERGKPGKHAKLWQWTDWLIKYLSDNRVNLMFMLWGKDAKGKQSLIDVNRHYVYTWIHPSPLAQSVEEELRFINCDNFEFATEMYLELYGQNIDWNPTSDTTIFTDGACTNNGKPNALGGYGVYFQTGPLKGLKIVSYLPESSHNGVKMKQTNNRAEILAAIDGLETYHQHRCIGNITLVVDNQLTRDIANLWIDNWTKYNKIEERKNPDLLYRYKKILDKIRDRQKALGLNFKIVHVYSHLKKENIPKKGTLEYTYYLGNEEVDRLANMGIKLSEQRCRQVMYNTRT